MAIETPISELNERAEAAYSSDGGENGARKKEDPSLLDILVILADRKRAIFWTTAVFALLAIVVSFLLPVRYTAAATLLPPQENSSLGAALASGMGSMGGSTLSGLEGMAALAGGGLGIKSSNDKYVGMLRSRIVEDAVIQRFGLMKEYHKKYLSDARKKFEDRTEIDGTGKDGLIHISVSDTSPQRAVEIVDGYVDQFRDLSQHLAIGEASQRRLFFEQQLVQAKNNLADAEEALKRTEQTTGLIQLDSQARALIETAATLRAQIAAHEMILQGMQTYATGQNSKLIQAEQELDSLRGQLAKLGGSQVSPDGLIVPKGLVPEAGLEYVRKLRDVKYYETIFGILAQQYELAKLQEAKEGALIQVVDPAILPDKESFPKRTLIVFLATFIGLVAGIFLALFQDSLHRMKDDPETSSKLIHLRRAIALRARGNT